MKYSRKLMGYDPAEVETVQKAYEAKIEKLAEITVLLEELIETSILDPPQTHHPPQEEAEQLLSQARQEAERIKNMALRRAREIEASVQQEAHRMIQAAKHHANEIVQQAKILEGQALRAHAETDRAKQHQPPQTQQTPRIKPVKKRYVIKNQKIYQET